MKYGHSGTHAFGSRLMSCNALVMFLVGIFCLGLALSSPLFAAEPPETPLFNIPFVEGLVVDGQADDWGDNGFKVEAMADMQGTDVNVADSDGRFRVAWDKRGVLLFIVVKDDIIVENDAVEHLYAKDAVEIFVADKRGGKQMLQALIAPGADGTHTSVRSHVYDRRDDAELKKIAYEPTCASATFNGGYIIEVLMPWEGLGVEPEQGMEIALQLYLDDFDPKVPGRSAKRTFTSMWYPGAGTHQNSNLMHRIRLNDKPSAPVSAVGRLHVKGYSHILTKAIGDASQVGSELQIEVSGQILGVGTFSKEGARAVASVKLPLPPKGTVWPYVDFRVGERWIERIAMPDLEAARNAAMSKLNLAFDSYCFQGDKLPSGSFPDAVEAENLLGAHKTEVTFYDADYREVSCAATPGRYAAFIKITPQEGEVLQRFVTLFRVPDDEGWDLPAENTAEQVRELAHRFEIAPEEKVTNRNNPQSMEQLWLHGLKMKLGAFKPYRYHVHAPESASKKDGKLYPAIIFLHGGAGLRRSFEESKELIAINYHVPEEQFPFFLFSPHSGPTQWQRTKLDELYNDVTTRYPVDPDRIYLTGLSMGGYGSWMYAAARPELFAAAVTVCGGGDPDEAEYLAELPIWNFHGDADPVVSIENSEKMISALEKVNGRVRYTIYEGVGHNVYEFCYIEPKLFPWLLEQVRGKPAESKGVKRNSIKQ